MSEIKRKHRRRFRGGGVDWLYDWITELYYPAKQALGSLDLSRDYLSIIEVMPTIQTISWKQLSGNKYNKAIDSAMASTAGYIAHQKQKVIGEPTPRHFKVKYDEEYVIQFIARKILRPLSYIGKQETIKLIDKAWDLFEDESEGV